GSRRAADAPAIGGRPRSGHAYGEGGGRGHGARNGAQMPDKLAVGQQAQIGCGKFLALQLRSLRQRHGASAPALNAQVDRCDLLIRFSSHARPVFASAAGFQRKKPTICLLYLKRSWPRVGLWSHWKRASFSATFPPAN